MAAKSVFFRGALTVVAALALSTGAASAQQPPSIYFNGDAANPIFELRGFDNASAAPRTEAPNEDWQRLFAIFVEQSNSGSAVPPMTGTYQLRHDAADHDTVIFKPRYPLQPGLSYRAVFHPGPPGGEALSKTFTVPKAEAGPQTAVEAVYPTAGTLPENLLKFYVHFSAPMSRGEAYQRVRLLDADGKPIDYAFLELEQELWDPEGRRLTLLFDPGRVKRDLLPNREVGSPLREGENYTLVVDRGWPDAHGRPLREEFRKPFTVAAADHETPSEKSWQVTAPTAGTTEPLSLQFPEPMDQALLMRVIDITTPTGQKIPGSIEVDQNEMRWQFRPDEPWKSGEYVIDAATVLEDLAGNSLVRPFEVDVFEKVEERVERVSRTLRFKVMP